MTRKTTLLETLYDFLQTLSSTEWRALSKDFLSRNHGSKGIPEYITLMMELRKHDSFGEEKIAASLQDQGITRSPHIIAGQLRLMLLDHLRHEETGHFTRLFAAVIGMKHMRQKGLPPVHPWNKPQETFEFDLAGILYFYEAEWVAWQPYQGKRSRNAWNNRIKAFSEYQLLCHLQKLDRTVRLWIRKPDSIKRTRALDKIRNSRYLHPAHPHRTPRTAVWQYSIALRLTIPRNSPAAEEINRHIVQHFAAHPRLLEWEPAIYLDAMLNEMNYHLRRNELEQARRTLQAADAVTKLYPAYNPRFTRKAAATLLAAALQHFEEDMATTQASILIHHLTEDTHYIEPLYRDQSVYLIITHHWYAGDLQTAQTQAGLLQEKQQGLPQNRYRFYAALLWIIIRYDQEKKDALHIHISRLRRILRKRGNYHPALRHIFRFMQQTTTATPEETAKHARRLLQKHEALLADFPWVNLVVWLRKHARGNPQASMYAHWALLPPASASRMG